MNFTRNIRLSYSTFTLNSFPSITSIRSFAALLSRIINTFHMWALQKKRCGLYKSYCSVNTQGIFTHKYHKPYCISLNACKQRLTQNKNHYHFTAYSYSLFYSPGHSYYLNTMILSFSICFYFGNFITFYTHFELHNLNVSKCFWAIIVCIVLCLCYLFANSSR